MQMKNLTGALLLAALTGGMVAPQLAMAQAPAAAAGQEKKETTGKVGEMIPALTAKVMRDGKEATLDTQKNGKVTAYVLVGVTCPATKPYAERLAALEAAYGPKGVDFVYAYVNKPESAADKAKFHKECKWTGAFWNDEGSAFAKALKAGKTGEVILTDKDGKVVYRGGIDDNLNDATKAKEKYVAAALEEVLAGKAVTKTTGKVFG